MKKMHFVFACLVAMPLFAQEAPIELPNVSSYINSKTQEQKILINSQEIEELKPESTINLLQTLGVTVKSNGGYGTVGSVSLRGFKGKDILVTVDGVPVNSAMNGETNFNAIPVTNIESIEIIKGAFISDVSVEGGVGGIIQITTKKQDLGNDFYVDLSGVTFFNNPVDRGQLKTGITIGKDSTTFKFDGNATYAENAFAYEDLNGKKTNMSDSRVIDGGALLQLLHYFQNGNELLIRNTFFASDAQINGGVLNPYGPSTGQQQDFNNSLLVTYDMPTLVEQWAFKASIQYDSNNQLYDTFGSFPSEDKHMLHSIQTSLATSFTPNNVFSQHIGLNFTSDILDSTQINENCFLNGSFKSTSEVSFSNRLAIILPLALTFSNQSISFVPKLGIQYGFEKGTIALNAYRLHQFPTLNDLYYSGGNPDLDSEHGVGGEITLNMHSLDFPFSASVFANYYFDKIQWYSPDPSDWSIPWRPENIGKSFYTGIDLLAEKELTSYFSLRANYQLVVSWILENGNSFSDNKRVIYTPMNTLALSGVLYDKNSSLSVTGNYVGERFTDADNTTKLLPYFLLEVAATTSVTDMLNVYTKISNAFNETYYETQYYPTSGISATLGLQISIDN